MHVVGGYYCAGEIVRKHEAPDVAQVGCGVSRVKVTDNHVLRNAVLQEKRAHLPRFVEWRVIRVHISAADGNRAAIVLLARAHPSQQAQLLLSYHLKRPLGMYRSVTRYYDYDLAAVALQGMGICLGIDRVNIDRDVVRACRASGVVAKYPSWECGDGIRSGSERHE